ncbi:hypothetical protein FA09DRAFT_213735 [Tilletiopsis washingtonensis]|uniref:Uncharacterized protein n=1 Tax=Tilletiopsis washingtonensis TaxID=58919 RepID=A0A316ZD65_9BASI|nr:hypothetical protein FA09DRAFT_213735 [Tilletiopsis washingtonensis]PWN99630.1 hypothetical protein FA09DRAFT_213735 [Tilletiopsis washingtonensis]
MWEVMRSGRWPCAPLASGCWQVREASRPAPPRRALTRIPDFRAAPRLLAPAFFVGYKASTQPPRQLSPHQSPSCYSAEAQRRAVASAQQECRCRLGQGCASRMAKVSSDAAQRGRDGGVALRCRPCSATSGPLPTLAPPRRAAHRLRPGHAAPPAS